AATSRRRSPGLGSSVSATKPRRCTTNRPPPPHVNPDVRSPDDGFRRSRPAELYIMGDFQDGRGNVATKNKKAIEKAAPNGGRKLFGTDGVRGSANEPPM